MASFGAVARVEVETDADEMGCVKTGQFDVGSCRAQRFWSDRNRVRCGWSGAAQGEVVRSASGRRSRSRAGLRGAARRVSQGGAGWGAEGQMEDYGGVACEAALGMRRVSG